MLVSRVGAFGQLLSRSSHSPHEQDSCPYNRDWGNHLAPFHHVRIHLLRTGLSPDTRSAGALILDYQRPDLWTFMLCINYLAEDIWEELVKWTKTLLSWSTTDHVHIQRSGKFESPGVMGDKTTFCPIKLSSHTINECLFCDLLSTVF